MLDLPLCRRAPRLLTGAAWIAAGLLLVAALRSLPAHALPSGDDDRSGHADCSMIDDFEAYEPGDTPYRWSTNQSRELTPATRRTMTDTHQFVIKEEDSNTFARAIMQDYAYRLIQLNGEAFDWNIEQCPVLSWKWRVLEFPEGAREDQEDRNDVPAAVYVTFKRTWYGAPVSIKYTYSSTLPVGTVVDYGTLMVLVVDSAQSPGTGRWKTVMRNVVADYQQLFGERPGDDTPVGIQLFSDADDVPQGKAVADFDDVRVLSPRR